MFLPLQLVGHDGTDRGADALAVGRALGEGGEGCRRRVVHVEEPPAAHLLFGDDGRLEAERKAAHQRLARVRKSLRDDEDLAVVEADSPARVLHEMAEEDEAAMIVVGPSRHSGAVLAILGTVADRLVHGGPCPVAIAAPGFASGPGAIRRIALAYDGGPEADAALEVTRRLAHDLRAVVDVITVHDPPVPIGNAALAGIPAEPADEVMQRALRTATRALDELDDEIVGAARTPGPPIGHAVVEAAGDADLIVCGSRAYGPVRRVLLGSTGRHIVHHARCSVVIVPRTADVAVPEDASGSSGDDAVAS